MKNIAIIARKELYRFFTDTRMIISTIILPALLIFCLYSVVGSGMSATKEIDKNHVFTIRMNYQYQLVNLLSEIVPNADFKTCENIEREKEKITDKKIDLLIIFPENFDGYLKNALNDQNQSVPNIEIYYNSSSNESTEIYQIVNSIFNTYEEKQFDLFSINKQANDCDLTTESDIAAKILSTLLPMLIIMFSYSSCMSIASEAIAGEKERGTLASLFMTPIKTWEFAFGKIISIATISLLGATSSLLGIALSLNKLVASEELSLSWNLYGIGDYMAVLGVIISTIVFLVAIISCISALSKTVKEASGYMQPLIIVISLIGMSPMLISIKNSGLYCIPIFNSAQILNGILSMQYSTTNLFITMASNLLFAGVALVFLSKILNNEEIMYNN